MDVILDIFKDKLFCFCVLYLKTLKKMYFHGFTVFPCILFLSPILGFPEQIQSLINCKFVDIKNSKAWVTPLCVTCIQRHLYRLPGNNPSSTNPLLATCATVRISSSPFKAKLFFVTKLSIYKVREPSLSPPAATTPAFFYERQFCSFPNCYAISYNHILNLV